jgi:cytoskeletal protein RodZ
MTVSKVLLYLIYAVIVAGMIVAIVLSFHTSKTPAPKARSNTSTHQQVTRGQASQPKSQPAPSTSANTPSTSTPSTSQSGPANSSQLANTGPGQTITLFLGISGLSAVAYRRYQLLRKI